MALIEWRKDFETGIPDVDYEHRELIELVNGVNERLQEGGDRGPVIEALGEIYARISGHFALEERIMRERGYDEYRDHKVDHVRLLDEIRDFMDAYEDGKVFDEKAFAQALSDWFTVHFKTRDARFHRRMS
jgi:hemerythrin-like metal-binding protein